MTNTKLTVIGGGKMGEAFIGGLIKTGWGSPDEITVVEPIPKRREDLERLYEGLVALPEVDQLRDVLLAVKPVDCKQVCSTLFGLSPERVLSIVAGVTIRSLETWLPDTTRVIRAMPNTPSVIGCGVAAVSPGTQATPEDLSWATEILTSVGEVLVLAEEFLDAVTGLSGSGPAYVFELAEALVDAGVAVGLDPTVADVLTRQTLLGAARLLAEFSDDPSKLRDDVTSPGGTTSAGLAVLNKADFGSLVRRVVRAATERSRELGEN